MKKGILIALVCSAIFATAQSDSWTAPSSANSLKNPFKGKSDATLKGKTLYKTYCSVCHGESGAGDGVGATSLNPKPANYTSSKVQAQTDGAIFWKLSEGKGAMAAYKNILSEEQRWQLVNYIRTFKK